MRAFIYLSAALLPTGILLVGLRETSAGSASRNTSGSPRPELEYFKAINSAGPPQDPQMLFLLMAQYSNGNLQGDGVEFFSARLREFGPRLTDTQKALYLSAIGLLRAQHAHSVHGHEPLTRNFGSPAMGRNGSWTLHGCGSRYWLRFAAERCEPQFNRQT